MELCDEIVRRRVCGKVRCGILEDPGTQSVSDVARNFELRDDAGCYGQISAARALALLTKILHRDLAYDSELMTREDAVRLAGAFLGQASSPFCAYFTNGDFFEEASSHSWNPATTATFDTGVLIIGSERSGCLWVEDED